MKNTDSVPRSQQDEQAVVEQQHAQTEVDKKKKEHKQDKKKPKRNTWPLKAMLITLLLSALVNVFSTLVLDGAKLWLAIVITLIIVLLGVIFDAIGTAATACDMQPLLAMAARKVKGAKTAVKLAKKSDIVSNICGDIAGDICGIVSGACSATIAAMLVVDISNKTWLFVLPVIVYALVSTLTVALKAVGKAIAIKNATGIMLGVAKILSIFHKEG